MYIKLQGMQNEWVNMKANFQIPHLENMYPKVQYMFPFSCRFNGKEYAIAPVKIGCGVGWV